MTCAVSSNCESLTPGCVFMWMDVRACAGDLEESLSLRTLWRGFFGFLRAGTLENLVGE